MHAVEIWLDVSFKEGDEVQPALTLFARHDLSTRPFIGESLDFLQNGENGQYFTEFTSIGPMKRGSVSVTVEDIRHYAALYEGSIKYTTSIRCSEFTVASESDLRTVCKFMVGELGFEIDPYGLDHFNLRAEFADASAKA